MISEKHQLEIVSQKFTNLFNLNVLPKDIRISTMTITCALPTTFNLDNIYRCVDLGVIGIQKVKFGPNKYREAENLPKKKSKPKKSKPKKSEPKKIKKVKKTDGPTKGKKKTHFYNQANCIVKPENGKKVNVKIFGNGSFHMTGCRSVRHCLEVLQTLFSSLRKRKAILDHTTNKIKLVPFVADVEKMQLKKLHSFGINMINSDFNCGFKVNQMTLFELLLEKDIDCHFEKLVHACVNIKYYCDDKKISIFVFESGSCIITGSTKCEDILSTYNFICKTLYENYNKVTNDPKILEDAIKDI